MSIKVGVIGAGGMLQYHAAGFRQAGAEIIAVADAAAGAAAKAAEKWNIAANIHETVIEARDGKKIWLTVVGDEDGPSVHRIQRGWYVAQALSDENAALLVKALAEFTRLYQPQSTRPA